MAEFRIPRSEELTARPDESGIERLEYDKRWGRYRIKLTNGDVAKHRELLVDLTALSAGLPSPTLSDE